MVIREITKQKEALINYIEGYKINFKIYGVGHLYNTLGFSE